MERMMEEGQRRMFWAERIAHSAFFELNVH